MIHLEPAMDSSSPPPLLPTLLDILTNGFGDARTKLLAVKDKVAALQHESTRVLDRIDKHLNRGKLT